MRERPLPTELPSRRRLGTARSRLRVVFDVLFNGAMLASALFLAFVVLARGERYAHAEQELAERTLQQRSVGTPVESGQIVLPSALALPSD